MEAFLPGATIMSSLRDLVLAGLAIGVNEIGTIVQQKSFVRPESALSKGAIDFQRACPDIMPFVVAA